MKRLLVTTSFIIVAALSACKQGQGTRCQVNSDCESPLVCSKATNTCENGSMTVTDADIIDSLPADAAVADAAADAATDAMPDAP